MNRDIPIYAGASYDWPDPTIEVRVIAPNGVRFVARAEYVPPGSGASLAVLVRRNKYGGRKGRSAARRLQKNTWVRGKYTMEPADQLESL